MIFGVFRTLLNGLTHFAFTFAFSILRAIKPRPRTKTLGSLRDIVDFDVGIGDMNKGFGRPKTNMAIISDAFLMGLQGSLLGGNGEGMVAGEEPAWLSEST